MTKVKEKPVDDASSTEDPKLKAAFFAGADFGALMAEPDEIVPRVATNAVQEPHTLCLDDIRHPHVVMLPEGYHHHDTQNQIENFERVLPAPRRRRGVYKAASVESFLRWMNDNVHIHAPVFARGAENLATKWSSPDLALIGMGNYSTVLEPQWHDFYAEFSFPVTQNWRAWTASHKQWMSHADFAEFIEGHLYEFSSPLENEPLSEAVTRMIEALGGSGKVATPSAMYALSEGVALTVSESVEVKASRSSGEMTLQFTEEHKGASGRPVTIPKFFYIRVPIFFGEKPSLVGALLRYRNAGGGSVTWQYELFAPDLVVKEAFDKAVDVVTDNFRTVYLGSPDLHPKRPSMS
jgi:uncharacterized protein YfdQ (DUF2303 family)